MGEIAVVTDSTAYLLEEEISRYHVTVVPLTVNFSDGFIYDGLVDTSEFFARVDKEAELPFTSQPAVGTFAEAYEKLIAAGKQIISVHLSARLSGTCESARQAAQMVDPDKITIIDSKTTSTALAFMVLAAAYWAEKGISRSAIAARLEKAADEVGSFFIVDNLEYLKKGGRIGPAQAFLGSMLQIKPILQFLDGIIHVFDKVRTKKKAISKMLELLPQDNSKLLKVAAIHCAAPADARKLKEMALEIAPRAAVVVREFGPVLSTHGGPGTLGIGFWAVDQDKNFPLTVEEYN